MATTTYYALESKNTYEYHYYYFAGLDDAGNVMITDEPGRIYTVLPAVEGQGRYMGTHLGFRVKKENGLEWQRGRFDFSIDSDQPNMLTATLDDYCGSSWDYDRVYHHQDSGLLFSEYFQEGGGEHIHALI